MLKSVAFILAFLLTFLTSAEASEWKKREREKLRLLNELGIDEEEYREMLKQKYGVSSSLALTKGEASELISELERRKKS
ncbi:phage protein GemA/Gp16 family protein [Hydrogenivirga sp.]